MAGFKPEWWPESNNMGGRHEPESGAGLSQNMQVF
jgi:hypothetical protein